MFGIYACKVLHRSCYPGLSPSPNEAPVQTPLGTATVVTRDGRGCFDLTPWGGGYLRMSAAPGAAVIKGDVLVDIQTGAVLNPVERAELVAEYIDIYRTAQKAFAEEVWWRMQSGDMAVFRSPRCWTCSAKNPTVFSGRTYYCRACFDDRG